MRLIIKGTYILDCGGTLADLGKEEMSRRYRDRSVLAHIKLSQYEDIDESPEHLAKVSKAFAIIKEKKVNVSLFLGYNTATYEDYVAAFEKVNLGHELLTREEYKLLKEALS